MTRSTTKLQIRRAELEARIEELVALLDFIDGDENLEDNGDLEPSFGMAQYKRGRLEYELEEDNADAEPFLGWSEHETLHNCNPLARNLTATATTSAGSFFVRMLRISASSPRLWMLPALHPVIRKGNLCQSSGDSRFSSQDWS